MAIIGDTIKLQAEFHSWDGEPASPNNVILKIYNMRKQQVGEDITPSLVQTGKYEYDFTIPRLPGDMFYYEFSGVLEGTPIVSRKQIDNIWAL